MSSRLLILNWHNVDVSWCFPAPPGATRAGFGAQLRWLARWARVVDLDAAVDDLRKGRPLPARAVALTFDDGYLDNLTIAAPMLSQYGMPATFFLVPGVLDGQVDPWWERLGWAFAHSSNGSTTDYQLACERVKQVDERDRQSAVDGLVEQLGVAVPRRPVPFLDWHGAQQLVRSGFTIGSHARDHAILSRESPEQQALNVMTARTHLQERLGVEVRGLAYPNGTSADYGPATVDAARQAGHDYAVTTHDGWNSTSTPPFELHRVVLYPERGRGGLSVLLRPAVERIRGRRGAPASI